MNIEQLEKMAETLYRTSGDTLPGSTAGNKDELMAHTIEHAIEYKTPLLGKLKAARSREEVYHILYGVYEDKTYGRDQ